MSDTQLYDVEAIIGHKVVRGKVCISIDCITSTVIGIICMSQHMFLKLPIFVLIYEISQPFDFKIFVIECVIIPCPGKIPCEMGWISRVRGNLGTH